MTSARNSKTALNHVLAVLLDFGETSPALEALHDFGIDSIDDIHLLTSDDLANLTYQSATETKPLNGIVRKKLAMLLRWNDSMIPTSNDPVPVDQWFTLTEDDYKRFCRQASRLQNPAPASSTAVQPPSLPPPVPESAPTVLTDVSSPYIPPMTTHITIHLDRARPLYIAGEEVTGKVVVTYSEEHSSSYSSVMATFVGASECCWKRSANEDATERTYWSRAFLYAQRTLAGKLYETGAQRLQTGSSQVLFAEGECQYVGEMIINTASSASYKVRVCYETNHQSYNFLLKGAVIGERELDVVASGEIQTLELSSTDSMNENDDAPRASHISVSTKPIVGSSLVVVQIYSVTFQQPAHREGMVYVQLYDTSEDTKANEPTLQEEYHFSFPLPTNTLGSAEWTGQHNRKGVIGYWLGAHMQSPQVAVTKQLIYVLARNPIPKRDMILPVYSVVNDRSIVCAQWGGYFSSEIGTVNIKLCLDRRLYAPWEAINLAGSTVTNNTSERVIIIVGLHRQVEFTALEGDIVRQEKFSRHYPLRIKGSIRRFAAKCWQEDTWNFSEEKLLLNIPPVPPSSIHGKAIGGGSKDYWPVRCIYSIQLTVARQGGESSIARAEIPIFVCAFPQSHEYVSSNTPKELESQEPCQIDSCSVGTVVDGMLHVDTNPIPLEIQETPGGERNWNELWRVKVGESKATFSRSTHVLNIIHKNQPGEEVEDESGEEGSNGVVEDELGEEERSNDEVKVQLDEAVGRPVEDCVEETQIPAKEQLDVE
jgi:hypothetical protein